ncbi:MAG: RnfABCDGE type electron transport complex subunit G [Candidatus Riflebacteria bacterium]|nr:RnfABCDGE type electron transport complex subunit G [Candidatus Riflebacteria bacterium]
MKDMLRMGSFLFIIAAVAGALLAITESITSPKIRENYIKKLEQARAEVLPQASKFSNIKPDKESAGIEYTAGFAENGELAGIVVNVAPKGYAGPIEMVLGLKADGSIAGVKILSQKETPGLGTKLADSVFLEPFKKLLQEKPKPIFKVKQDGGDIDGITAATISSRAFCAGVRDAMSTYEKIKPQLQALTAPGDAK